MLADGGNRGVGVAAEERKRAATKEKREKNEGQRLVTGEKKIF